MHPHLTHKITHKQKYIYNHSPIPSTHTHTVCTQTLPDVDVYIPPTAPPHTHTYSPRSPIHSHAQIYVCDISITYTLTHLHTTTIYTCTPPSPSLPQTYSNIARCPYLPTLIYNTTAPPMHSHPHAHMHVPDTFTPADSIQTPLPLPHTHRQVQIYFLHPYSDPHVHTAPEDYLNHHVCTYKPRHSDTQTHILYIDPPPTHSHIRTYTRPPSPAHHLHIHVHLLTHTRSRPCICVGTNACPYPVPHLIFHAHTFTHRYTRLTHAGIHVESPHSYTYRHPHADTHRHICTSHPFSLSLLPSLSFTHVHAHTHSQIRSYIYTPSSILSRIHGFPHTVHTYRYPVGALLTCSVSHMHVHAYTIISHTLAHIRTFSYIRVLAARQVFPGPLKATHVVLGVCGPQERRPPSLPPPGKHPEL